MVELDCRYVRNTIKRGDINLKIGNLIKMERMRQNIKQDVLARGICSPSHLSKIESNATVPGVKVQQQLLKRLNISLNERDIDPSSEAYTHFFKRFEKLLGQRDDVAAKLLHKDIHSFLDSYPLYQHTVSLLLLINRLDLIVTKDLTAIKEGYSLLASIQNEMTKNQKFHLCMNEGIIAYMENRYTNALHIFSDLYKRHKEYDLEDWALADLHYVFSLASLSDYRYLATINHIQEALAYYNAKILVKRSIECLLILGIAQKHNGDIDEALATFNKAKEIMTHTDTTQYIGIIQQNLGACYSLKQDTDRALVHFNKSLKAKEQPLEKITTILSIVKEYKKMNHIETAKEWLTKGISLLDQLNIDDKLLYFQHFTIYKALLYEEKDFTATFESALKYFESTQNYYRCFVYCNILAEKLTTDHKFKLATTFYKKAFNYHLKYRKLQYWEDLT